MLPPRYTLMPQHRGIKRNDACMGLCFELQAIQNKHQNTMHTHQRSRHVHICLKRCCMSRHMIAVPQPWIPPKGQDASLLTRVSTGPTPTLVRLPSWPCWPPCRRGDTAPWEGPVSSAHVQVTHAEGLLWQVGSMAVAQLDCMPFPSPSTGN